MIQRMAALHDPYSQGLDFGIFLGFLVIFWGFFLGFLGILHGFFWDFWGFLIDELE